jgi:hypothetical protein
MWESSAESRATGELGPETDEPWTLSSQYAVGTRNPKRGAQGREVLGRDIGINRVGETNFRRGTLGESLPSAGTAFGIPEGPVVQRATRSNRETGTQYPDYDAV